LRDEAPQPPLHSGGVGLAVGKLITNCPGQISEQQSKLPQLVAELMTSEGQDDYIGSTMHAQGPLRLRGSSSRWSSALSRSPANTKGGSDHHQLLQF